MNKKYIGAFALAAMTLLSTGCSDFLDQDSRSNVSTDSFYKTSTGSSYYFRAYASADQIRLWKEKADHRNKYGFHPHRVHT